MEPKTDTRFYIDGAWTDRPDAPQIAVYNPYSEDVIGHIAAVVLAHRIAVRDAPGHPIIAGLPLVLLMIGYTVPSLWIIAQPIAIEPDALPVSLLLR